MKNSDELTPEEAKQLNEAILKPSARRLTTVRIGNNRQIIGRGLCKVRMPKKLQKSKK